MYKEDYAAFPTTTHFVERSVKVSNYCGGSNKSRCEERTSQFAICYNIVHDVNDVSKKEMIRKKTEKGETYKEEAKLKARGKTRQKIALGTVLERHHLIEDSLQDPNFNATYGKIKSQMNLSSKSFKSIRQQKEFESNEAKSIKVRKPNVTERMTGFDIMPVMSNQVRLHNATKDKYEKGIDLELIARGVEDFSIFPNFKAQKKKLKELSADEMGIPIQDCTHFNIKSTFDWSGI